MVMIIQVTQKSIKLIQEPMARPKTHWTANQWSVVIEGSAGIHVSSKLLHFQDTYPLVDTGVHGLVVFNIDFGLTVIVTG